MKLVSTLNVKPGMRLAKPVFTDQGQMLVSHRTELNERTIVRLHDMGYEYLYIDDPMTSDIYVEDTLRLETRNALSKTLELIYNTVRSMPSILIDGNMSLSNLCWDSISMVISDLKYSRNDLIMLANTNPQSRKLVEGHFVQNAINVCTFATKLGIKQGLHGNDLRALSMGALLHDIGTLRIPEDILGKPAPLNSDEFNVVKRHSYIGYEMLKQEPGIPITTALCALMHHERVDGSGYPNRLKGEDIHPYARMIAIIDAYDAMTNPRPYRKALLPHEAMELLYANAGTLFDKEFVEIFRNNVAIFPVGLHVLLSTGEEGVVTRIHPTSIHRPVIRILKTASGRMLPQPYEIDLSESLHIMIEQVGVCSEV